MNESTNETFELILERIADPNTDIQKAAIDALFDIVRSNTCSATSSNTLSLHVLDKHKRVLEEQINRIDNKHKKYYADILSAIFVIADTYKTLHYRMQGGIIPLETWGHQYAKRLAGSIVDLGTQFSTEEINKISDECVTFLFAHNSECDAIDFLYEIKRLEKVLHFVEEDNYERIILYLNELGRYEKCLNKKSLEDPSNIDELIISIHKTMNNLPLLIINLLKNRRVEDAIQATINSEEPIKSQLCYILARCGVFFNASGDSRLENILKNHHIKENFKYLIDDLQIAQPRDLDSFIEPSPKKDLKEIKHFVPLAIANSFVHMGFGIGALPMPENGFDKPEIISILASMGVINSWNSDRALEDLDDFLFSNGIIRAGAGLGLALATTKIVDENEISLAILSDEEEGTFPSAHARIASLLGIEAIYCGSQKEDLKEKLRPLVFSESDEISAFACYVLGSIFIGSGDDDITGLLLQAFIEKSAIYSEENTNPFFSFYILGLGFLYYKRNCKDILEKIDAIESNFKGELILLLKAMRYAGTGNTNIIEELLTESFDNDTTNNTNIGLLSVALVALGDELSTKMITRLIRSSGMLNLPKLKSAIPLCLALLYPSTPEVEVIDDLVKLLNSGDTDVVLNTIIALGLVGAGTNNTRIIDILNHQYSYHSKSFRLVSALRISIGLVHLGKGTLTINPWVYRQSLLLTKEFVGLFSLLFISLEGESSVINGKYSFLYYLLCQSVTPKYLICVDTTGKYKSATVRIGTPVNRVGMVGHPRSIVSVQTHVSPVIVQSGERAEVEDAKTLCEIAEDIVVCAE
ncbi:26S proteasome regulatory subunit RPN1 [Astathelohania contejeani]|uniref:26S proteasome regulatory subunit RPN1 n=1 Tax=Astathelohania contejeani TaxID=164912 RepID=A0ABQ7I305_9MICR|nr:26S proteasome regulatory subunit RPN1 [Thelohania contejeani]